MTDIYYKETKCLRENCLFYIGAGIRYRKYRESSARALAWSLFKPKATSYMIKCNNLVRHCLLKIYLFQPILCCEPGCWFSSATQHCVERVHSIVWFCVILLHSLRTFFSFLVFGNSRNRSCLIFFYENSRLFCFSRNILWQRAGVLPLLHMIL